MDYDYEHIRARIKTGDMLLWRDHAGGPIRAVSERWIVRHTTASPYTHVGIALVWFGRVWVMDLTTKGCAPRLLSECGDFDWATAPRELSSAAVTFAFACFGEWVYSRWQAILGKLKRLVIGQDRKGQCAEFALAVWMQDGMAPTDEATPGACADGAMLVWRSSLMAVSNPSEATVGKRNQ